MYVIIYVHLTNIFIQTHCIHMHIIIHMEDSTPKNGRSILKKEVNCVQGIYGYVYMFLYII